MFSRYQGGMKVCFRFAIAAGVLSMCSAVWAQAIITSTDGGASTIALGVNPEGHLNAPNGTNGISAVNASRVGLSFQATGPQGFGFYDATAPGVVSEGWGVSANGVSGSAKVSFGVDNLTVDSFTSTPSSITSSVHLTSDPGISVTQAYSEVVPGKLFENKVSIANATGGALNDLRYARVMDWDIFPDEFNEHVTIQGTSATELEASHENGFASADPLASSSTPNANMDFIDIGPSDLGAYFRFNFGALADGEVKEFSVFYGAAPSETEMLAALASQGAELFSLGQAGVPDPNPFNANPVLGTPATYAFGFKGVGGTVILPPGPAPVPEPASIAAWAVIGVIGLVAPRRRRKRNQR